MTDAQRYHGGMVFFGRDHAILHRFCDRIAETLEDYGHPVERHGMTADDCAGITASHYHITLTTSPYSPAPNQGQRSRRVDAMDKLNLDHPQPAALPTRLVIDMRPADPAGDDTDISELLLAVMLYRLVDLCDACAVEWLSPDTVLTMDQFLSAFSDLSPHLVPEPEMAEALPDCATVSVRTTARRRAQGSPQPCDRAKRPLVRRTEDLALARTFRTPPDAAELTSAGQQDEPPSDIRRLATWGMTGMMVFLSTPVAVSMAAVNLIRGEDFRMNTQVLSLTGLLVSLQSSGALASAVSYIPL